mgnify:CR=1 FL=1
MKKKYVVYSESSYYDDFDFLHCSTRESGTYYDVESAEMRAYELRCLGFGVQIIEK